MDRVEYIFNEATSTDGTFTAKEIALFHGYNENGVCSQLFALQTKVSKLDMTDRDNLITYFSLDATRKGAGEEIKKMSEQSRVSSLTRLNIYIEILQEEIDVTNEKIATEDK